MACDIVSDIQDPSQKQDRVRRSCWLCNDCEAEDADDAATVLFGRMLGLGILVARIIVHHLVVSVQAGLGSRMRNRRRSLNLIGKPYMSTGANAGAYCTASQVGG